MNKRGNQKSKELSGLLKSLNYILNNVWNIVWSVEETLKVQPRGLQRQRKTIAFIKMSIVW